MHRLLWHPKEREESDKSTKCFYFCFLFLILKLARHITSDYYIFEWPIQSRTLCHDVLRIPLKFQMSWTFSGWTFAAESTCPLPNFKKIRERKENFTQKQKQKEKVGVQKQHMVLGDGKNVFLPPVVIKTERSFKLEYTRCCNFNRNYKNSVLGSGSSSSPFNYFTVHTS